MLLPFVPIAFVSLSIWPFERSKTLFHVGLVVSFVVFAIWPREFSISIYLIILPSSDVYSLIGADEGATAILWIVFKWSLVITSVCPELFTCSLFYSCSPIALICKLLIYCLLSKSMILSVQKSTGVFVAVGPYLGAFAVLHRNPIYHLALSIIFHIVR